MERLSGLSDEALLAEVAATHPAPGGGACWWLGQHGFLMKLGETVIGIDLFLTDLPGRRVPPLLRPELLGGLDLLLGSHDHADHIDRDAWPVIAAAGARTRFVVPEILLDRLPADLGIPRGRFLGANDGATIEAGPVRITGVAAAHEFLDRDPASGRYPYLGFVVRGNGCAVYHAGDSCIYEGLLPRVRRQAPGAVLLPINGRDAARLRRNCIGNMTYQEAADLAGALGPRLTVPTHFDMFDDNRGEPVLFAEYMAVKYPALRVMIPEHGRRFSLAPSNPGCAA